MRKFLRQSQNCNIKRSYAIRKIGPAIFSGIVGSILCVGSVSAEESLEKINPEVASSDYTELYEYETPLTNSTTLAAEVVAENTELIQLDDVQNVADISVNSENKDDELPIEPIVNKDDKASGNKEENLIEATEPEEDALPIKAKIIIDDKFYDAHYFGAEMVEYKKYIDSLAADNLEASIHYDEEILSNNSKQENVLTEEISNEYHEAKTEVYKLLYEFQKKSNNETDMTLDTFNLYLEQYKSGKTKVFQDIYDDSEKMFFQKEYEKFVSKVDDSAEELITGELSDRDSYEMELIKMTMSHFKAEFVDEALGEKFDEFIGQRTNSFLKKSYDVGSDVLSLVELVNEYSLAKDDSERLLVIADEMISISETLTGAGPAYAAKATLELNKIIHEEINSGLWQAVEFTRSWLDYVFSTMNSAPTEAVKIEPSADWDFDQADVSSLYYTAFLDEAKSYLPLFLPSNYAGYDEENNNKVFIVTSGMERVLNENPKISGSGIAQSTELLQAIIEMNRLLNPNVSFYPIITTTADQRRDFVDVTFNDYVDATAALKIIAEISGGQLISLNNIEGGLKALQEAFLTSDNLNKAYIEGEENSNIELPLEEDEVDNSEEQSGDDNTLAVDSLLATIPDSMKQFSKGDIRIILNANETAKVADFIISEYKHDNVKNWFPESGTSLYSIQPIDSNGNQIQITSDALIEMTLDKAKLFDKSVYVLPLETGEAAVEELYSIVLEDKVFFSVSHFSVYGLLYKQSDINEDLDVENEKLDLSDIENFELQGHASFDKNNKEISLTPDVRWNLGSVSVKKPFDLLKDFDLIGELSLGNKSQLKGGADGISLIFHNSPVYNSKNNGGALGFGADEYAFGFKLDTYYNGTAGNGYEADPRFFFRKDNTLMTAVHSQKSKMTATENKSILVSPPKDNEMKRFRILYKAPTEENQKRIIDFYYDNEVVSIEVDPEIDINTPIYFTMMASTGASINEHKVKFYRISPDFMDSGDIPLDILEEESLFEEPPVEEPTVEKPPVEEPPVEEPPVEEPPVEEPPIEEPPVEEPVVEEPSVEEPSVEVPLVEEPAVEEPTVEEPAVEEPPVEEPPVEEPPVEEPTVEEPAVGEPPVEEPPVEEPSVEEPAVEEPAVEEPLVEEPPVEEPTVEEPAVEEPAVEEPPVEEPPVEEPAVEEPPVEEPAVEEPAVEEPPVEEPVVEEPTVEEPPVEKLSVEGEDLIETESIKTSSILPTTGEQSRLTTLAIAVISMLLGIKSLGFRIFNKKQN